MLKKKRFSGLFGPSMTDIPSPSADQPPLLSASSPSSEPGSSFGPTRSFSPQMLSTQGRQPSLATLGTSSGAISNTPSFLTEDEASSNPVTRAEVHQSLENLKKLVIAAESYRELTAKLAKTTKQLGRCFKEFGDSKGMDSTHVMCLKASANFYESFSEMETKLATCLQKDFDMLQTNWEKHSKRVQKDEKAHDEVLADLDERIKKISMSHDKKSKKPDPNTALVSHEKYISSLSELQDSIAFAKREHRNTVARRERYTHSLTAQIACRLAEAQFLAIERQLRGSGPSLIKIKEWAPYAGQDMPPPTLVTSGDPTIEIRASSFEEYAAKHASLIQSPPVAYPSFRSDSGFKGTTGSREIGSSSSTAMPQITLPPFAPMQQHLQEQQEKQQQQQMPQTSPLSNTITPPKPFSATPLTLPTSMPVPRPTPMATIIAPTPASVQLPIVMPEPNNYIVSKQTPHTTISQTAVLKSDTMQQVAVEDTENNVTPISIRPPVLSISSTESREPAIPVTTSPSRTLGAFPVVLNTSMGMKDGEIKSKILQDLKLQEARADGLDRIVAEDQGSVSTKVGSMDGASTQAERINAKLDYIRQLEQEDALAAAEDAADAALDRYHREKYLDRYGLDDEGALYRDEPHRQHDDLRADVLYVDPYSPAFYDERDDESRIPPRRFYDDEESQHSGSNPTTRERGEYFGRVRFEEREYGQTFQHYSSSLPAQHRQLYLGDREQEQGDWISTTSGGESGPISGYAREQYPAPREHYTRPTLEDRERELELLNQKQPGVPGVSTASRRPATAPGTVAHLRRRFSDQSVSDLSPPHGDMVSPSPGSRLRGLSATGPHLLQLDGARRDSRYPPRASTPQSRAVAASSQRYERNGGKVVGGGSSGQLVGAGSRYGAGSDYEEGGAPASRLSMLMGDQRNRRR